MPSNHRSIVHQEVIQLAASPQQVRSFVMTPERILDYYPSSIDCGQLEPGRSLFCRGKSGVSLLELDEGASDDSTLVVNVTTAMQVSSPVTAEKIKRAVFFTMVEDWKIEADGNGTKLTKTWRDIRKHKLRLLPMGRIVRKSARGETRILKRAWDKAALDEE